ncbi:DNA polymerase III subunit delta [Gulosibacter molinativorax]|uniref:DNA-directed DNA polymerase n=1 Tax=Gulosibacter molinativorax TaxID=256821 RepID=A0ABT7C8Z4_9MICO|nr:DNA polymerase III subunit delta [Gulosibacter molinativorax]MDJ1371627.1 DNA polymerase III subunit delta [Gulosibacter molinativorax]QUY61030.1 DNA polymerase III subunit delta [Gulosibacter molinativorax]
MAATKGRAKASAKSRIPQVHWREVRPAPVVLVSGAEDFFASEAITGLRTMLRTEDPSLEVHDLDASSYAPGELTTLVSPSLFMEPRLVVAERVHQTVDAFLQEALDYVAAPIEGTTLVLRHASGVRGKKLLDAVRAMPDAIEIACVPLKANEYFGFAMAEFRMQGRRAQPQAVQALVAAFSTDIAELAAACRQLMSVSGDEEISPELVERYYGGRVETTGFKIADSAIAGRFAEAMLLVRSGLDTGLNAVPIVAAFAMKLRMMAKVYGLAGSDAQLAKTVGGAPWQIGQARRETRGWSELELASAIMLVAETDHLVKGGSRSPEYAVERLVRCVAARDFSGV